MAKQKTIGVGMIGCGFMGKSHGNAYVTAARFFDLPARPVLKGVCGLPLKAAQDMADQWGFEYATDDYKALLKDDEIELISILTPNNLHAKVAIDAAKAGKHIICEKPLAMNAAEAKKMVAAVKKANIVNMAGFCYRRCPAVSLAKELIDDGKLGRIFHVRAAYLQDWIVDPEFPLLWRMAKKVTGSGAHGDLNAHIIDMARFLVGEFEEVCGDMNTFVKERPLPAEGIGLSGKGGKKKGKVDVDDALSFLARLTARGGAKGDVMGLFEATRFATGNKNQNMIEVNGSKGSLRFRFERMNELDFYDATKPQREQGWTNILVTEPVHPYVGSWWPPGHLLGYEHSFVHEVVDTIQAICSRKKEVKPDFEDGMRCNEVLDASLASAKSRKWVKVKKL
ncbi:MAG: Gfo/Idh/MocA family oxidoreductase [Planctomycetes bacterium]|nr:Gfo/Idh/MocA family oxidoreductase [Planctomycetota bacterium]